MGIINSISKLIKCGGECEKCGSSKEIVYYTAKQNFSDSTKVQTYFYENVRCEDCNFLKFKGVSHRNKISTPASKLIDGNYFKSNGLIYHGYLDPYIDEAKAEVT